MSHATPAPATAPLRLAPPGLTPTQREQFDREGFLVLEDALSAEEVARYVDAIDRCAAADAKYTPDAHWGPQNIVERDPVFAELIDHDRHVGYAYDFYGELTKLQQSQCMKRPRGGWHNLWHPDGPRALPYNVFSPTLPLQVKVGYWLTDLPRRAMGNFVCLPGSHRQQYADHYDTHDDVAGQHILTCRAGTITLMHNALWHRVEPDESDVVRKNIFITYSPSWICNQDRWHSDPDWLATLNREQRILMRSYDHAYDWAKPRASEFPLFLDRATGSDHDADQYRDDIKLERRKRKVAHEKTNGDCA